MRDVPDVGPFFHGTKADLQVGDLLTAGTRSSYRPEVLMNHLHVTALPDVAELAAELAAGNGAPRAYAVEPTARGRRWSCGPRGSRERARTQMRPTPVKAKLSNAVAAGVASLACVVLVACAGPTSASHTASGSASQSAAPSPGPSVGPLPSGTFVAEYTYGIGATGAGHGTFLSLFDDVSGGHLRDLLHFDGGAQLALAGFSRTVDGSVIYAAARGPYYRSHVNGGDPRPGSCGGTVSRLDARTGGVTSLFGVGEDWTVGAPVLSPDGRSIAYVSQACTAMFAARVVVRVLATGTERKVWVPNTSAMTVHWSSDGRQLVFTVMYAEPRSDSDVPSYVVVPSVAVGAQPSSAVRRAPDRGCVVQNAVYSRSGIELVEGCPDVVTAPALLVQLRGDGPAVEWRRSTALCPNGMTAAYDAQGRLLVTAETRCGGAGSPVDVVQMWDGHRSRDVGRYPNEQQIVSAAA